ncbi:MAG: hypothetical protein LBC84_04695 [Prevotellaceae bacterium]|jgi:hypothetical protein|nr:hypothetical protein [Prevotellaceae bacterium]
MIKNALKLLFTFFLLIGSFAACKKNDSSTINELEEFEETIVVPSSNPCPCENYLEVSDFKGKAYIFNSPISALQNEELMQERKANGYVAWIVYNPDTDVATLNIRSSYERSYLRICNYHEYANPNLIETFPPVHKGVVVYYEAKAYMNKIFESAPPSIYYDLLLTTFKKY